MANVEKVSIALTTEMAAIVRNVSTTLRRQLRGV